MSKVNKNFSVNSETLEYLENIKKNYSLRSVSAALDMIVSEHQKAASDEMDLIAERMINKIEQKYDNIFTRMRLGIRTADVNSQVLIEILNSLILNMDIDRMYDTDILESNIVKESREIIKERIERYKQFKDNRSK